MATNTTNYNLKKPAATDNYNVADQNSNMDIIDGALTPTADPAQVPTGSTGKLSQWVSWITNRIKVITGGSNWYDAPATTLQAANTHANSTTAHSATSAAAANRIMMRDASGRVKVAAPAVADDVARKDTVDALAGVGNTKTVKQVDDAVGQLAANMENIGDSVIVKSPTPPAGIVEGRLWLDESDNTYQGTIMEDYLAHSADYVRQPGYGTTGGSANNYTLTLDPALAAYTAGVCIAVKIHAANTGATTINVNGLGAKAVMDSKGNAMTSGKLRLNGVYTLRYDGTNFILQGDGSEERQGDNVALASSVSGTTLKLTAPAGEYDGIDDTVTITDTDFIQANIKNGINIFGVTGNVNPVYKASGTATSSPSNYAFKDYNNAIQYKPTLSVNTLTFTPKLIIITRPSAGYRVFFSETVWTNSNTALAILGSYALSTSCWQIIIDNTVAAVWGNGFAMPVFGPNESYNWEAYSW